MAWNMDPTLRSVFDYICEYDAAHGVPPSQREIAEACYISKGTVSTVLFKLETRRLIERKPGRARGIRITEHCAK